MALPVGANGAAGRRHQRAIGTADTERFHARQAARDGTARCAVDRHAGRKHGIGGSMERQEEIDRLKTRLHWDSGGPIAHLANQALATFVSSAEALAGWVRESGEERPLISLLLAFQLGFAAGRWGPRRAKRYPPQGRVRRRAAASARDYGAAGAARSFRCYGP